MDLKIKGKRALVLGASAGLGRAVAETLIREGVRVAVVSRDEKRILAAAKEIGAEAGLVGDLTRPGDATRVVKEAIAKLGGVDILLVNSGGPPKVPFAELTLPQWQEGFQNLWLSAIEAIQAAMPGMKERKWGRILFVTSVAAKEAMPQLTISNGLRAGLLGLTRTLSNEVAADGITVNSLLPGFTRTERLKELNLPEEKMTTQIPARRLGEPGELAALATFLASDQAAYITGQSIACDGGYLRGF